MRKYSAVKTPRSPFMRVPRACAANCDSPQEKASNAAAAAQADAFEAGAPQARVVRIAGAQHYVFRSSEDQVVQEMNGFMDGLH